LLCARSACGPRLHGGGTQAHAQVRVPGDAAAPDRNQHPARELALDPARPPCRLPARRVLAALRQAGGSLARSRTVGSRGRGLAKAPMSAKSAVLLIALLAAACATPDPYRLDGPRSGAGVELAPYALREECFRLDPGDRIDFYFSSTAAVAFNI